MPRRLAILGSLWSNRLSGNARRAELVVLTSLLVAVAAGAAADDTAGLAAYFPFDESAGEASGDQIFGQLVTEGGIATGTTPEYVDGRFGSAIRFSGETALRIPLDLHPESYPQLTITAWVFLEDLGDKGDVILATGEGDGAALRRSGRALEARVGPDLLVVENALSPSRWNFIAGVWDYESGVARLHWRTRSVERVIEAEELAPPEPDIWLGAINDSLADAADNLRVDELRIYSRALDPEEIAAVRDSEALKGRLTSTAEASASRPPQVIPSRRPDVKWPKVEATVEFYVAPKQSPAAEEDEPPETSEAPFAPVVVPKPIPKSEPLKLRPRIVGAPSSSALSGRRADIVQQVDFKDRAIDSLQWSEKFDKPCEIEVIDRDAKRRSMVSRINQCANKGFACEDTPCLRDAVEYHADEVVRLAPNQAITAIRVCLNSSRKRVKGIEIRGGEILATGRIDPDGSIDKDRLPNCDRWETLVFCPNRRVATGLRAHFKKGKAPSANVDVLTGLELICREVQLREVR